jgi:DNA-binding transcriptional MerR regulator
VAGEIEKAASAFRTISEVAEELQVPQHVLRFWETRFSAVRPIKRGGNRRYYRPEDLHLLKVINHLLYTEGYTIRGVQKLLREQGPRQLISHHTAPQMTQSQNMDVAFVPAPEPVSASEFGGDAAPFAPIAQPQNYASRTQFDVAPKSMETEKAAILASLQQIRADVVQVLG